MELSQLGMFLLGFTVGIAASGIVILAYIKGTVDGRSDGSDADTQWFEFERKEVDK
jgi:hypothetical protein